MTTLPALYAAIKNAWDNADTLRAHHLSDEGSHLAGCVIIDPKDAAEIDAAMKTPSAPAAVSAGEDR